MNQPAPARGRSGLRDWLIAGLVGVFALLYLGPLLRDWGVPGIVSTILALALGAALAVPFGLLFAMRQSQEYSDARGGPVGIATSCAVSVVLIELTITASGAHAAWLGTCSTVAAAVVTWGAAYRYASDSRETMLDRRLVIDDPRHAAELVERCEAELAGGALDAERHAVVSLTLAGALVALSGSPGNEDELARALSILAAELAAGDCAEAVFRAAEQAVAGLRVKRQRTGDDVGYDTALELMAEAARRAQAEVRAAPGLVEAAWAQRLADDAEDGGDLAPAFAAAAIARLEAAVAATPQELPEHALHVAVRARLQGAHPLHGDLDASITQCRASVRRLRRTGGTHLATARLALIDLLELRAAVAPGGGLGGTLERGLPGLRNMRVFGALWPERAGNDLARAMWLCMQVARDAGPAGAEARERVTRLREELMRREVSYLPGVLHRPTGWMYRHVAQEQHDHGYAHSIKVCERWAAWSDSRGNVDQSAEAWWCWVSAVGSDLRRRVFAGKERTISRVQGLFVEAADRLVRAGRTQQAALALELGRAVLLTERMYREREGLDARLVAAGRTDLAQRWRHSMARIEGSDPVAMIDGPRGEPAALASVEYLALTEYEALLREISRLPGFEDVDAAPEYDDLLLAAAEEGPIVYLAVRDSGGLALVVDRGAQEPRVVELPATCRARVREQVEQLHAATHPFDVAATMKELLPALHEEIVRPLLAHVAAPALVTLIPIGELAELPLHMAGVAADESGVWRDRTGGVVFRYSPNARVLLRAGQVVEAIRDDELRLLTAAVPDAPGWPPLTDALAESRGVAACFAPRRAVRAEPATIANVMELLEDASIWHFACHGTHNSEAPLDSTLQLSDGALTARTLLGGRGRRRLAVLSACQTALVGALLPDEVVGFSSALLQAGVAGVVSCHADVEDHAATILILAFFARFAHEPSPARALAAAQAWLRSATNEDVHAAFPDVHPWTDRDDDERWRRYRPFADPTTWVRFSYTGA